MRLVFFAIGWRRAPFSCGYLLVAGAFQREIGSCYFGTGLAVEETFTGITP